MGQATTVDQLAGGDHACLTFSDPDERVDLLAAFVRDGLAHGQRVACFTQGLSLDQLRDELAERSVPVAEPLRRGQLALAGPDDEWQAGGGVTATKMVDLLSAARDHAVRDGHPGLRVTVDMGWAVQPAADPEELIRFETDVAALFTGGQLTAVCQYDRSSFDPVTLAFAARAHDRTVAAVVYHEDPILRICRQHVPTGVRVAGEIDYRHAEVFRRALAESLRLDDQVTLNLRHLRYLDATIAAAVLQVAAALVAPRCLTVAGPPLVRAMMEACGAAQVPQLRVVVAR